MNYENIYNALVEKAKVRGLDKSQHEGYFEIHHIIPKCLGGSDDKENLVMFTAREHVFAHICLWKVYPKHLGIVSAAQMMTDTREYGKYINTKVLAKLREESSELRKLRLEGAGYGETRHIDLSGQTFGRLTVLDNYNWYHFPNGQRKAKWDCICECGNTTSVIVGGLTSGYTNSCGCWHKEQTSKANKKWEFSRKIYQAYKNMMTRCYSPYSRTYAKFSEQGIEVCERWQAVDDQGLLNFVEDMGEPQEDLVFGRINNLEDFSPENCKWMTQKELVSTQVRTKRKNTSVWGKGVKLDKRRGTFTARITVEGKEISSKSFKTYEEALEQRKLLVLEHYGVVDGL